MRKLSGVEFEQLLSEISLSCLLDEYFLKQIKKLGVDPFDWPDCRAKRSLIEFLTIEEVKGFQFAQISCGKDLLTLETDYIPKDPKRIYELYKFNIDCFKFSALASELLKNPEKGFEIIESFKSSRKENINFINLKDNILPVIQNHMNKIKEGRSFVGLPDFPILSKSISGFGDSRLTLISAKSGMGKTKLAVNLALSAAKVMPVFYFNMEMSKDDMVSMFIHNKLGIKNSEWADGSFLNPYSQDRILNSEQLFSDLDINLTCGESLNLIDIASSISLKAKNAFIIVDYDQKIITNGRKEEWKEILEAAHKLENLAKETKSHIILLAQANEEGDIKASSRSKQPASAVLNLYKDETLNRYLLRSIKNRWGADFEIELSFDHSRSQVAEVGLVKQENIGVKTKKYV